MLIEFLQLDMEMSFATGDDVMRTIEGVIRRLWVSCVRLVGTIFCHDFLVGYFAEWALRGRVFHQRKIRDGNYST
jgi:hypothetical protein